MSSEWAPVSGAGRDRSGLAIGEDHGLGQNLDLAALRMPDFARHVQVMHLLVGERAIHGQDGAARRAGGIEALDPLRARALTGPRDDLLVERGAVFHPQPGRGKARIVDQARHFQHVAQAREHARTHGSDIDVAVGRGVDTRGRTGGMVVAGLPGHLAVDQPARGLEIHHPHLRLQQRGLHPTPLARLFAVQQRDQDADGCEQTGAEIRDGNAGAHGPAIRLPGDGHQPTEALPGTGGPVCPGRLFFL